MPLYTEHNFRVGQRVIEDLPISRTAAFGAFVESGLEARALMGADRELSNLLSDQKDAQSRQEIEQNLEQFLGMAPGEFKLSQVYADEFATKFYSKDEANERGKPLGITFNDRVTVAVFDRLTELKRDEIKRQNAQVRSALPMPVEFAASMLGTLADPLELGLNFVPVPGVNALTRRIGSKVAQRAVRGAAEGFAGSVIVEPLVYSNMTRQQADYTMQDSLLNIAMGTVAGSALHVTLGGVGDLYVRRTKRAELLNNVDDALSRIELDELSAKQDFTTAQRLDATSPKTKLDAMRATVGQKLDGRVNDVSEILEGDPGYRNPDHTASEIRAERSGDVNIKSDVEAVNARNTGVENLEFVDPEVSKLAETDNKANVDIKEPDQMDARLADDEAVLMQELETLDIPDDVKSALGLEAEARIVGEGEAPGNVPKVIAEATEAVKTSHKLADAIRFIGDCLSG